MNKLLPMLFFLVFTSANAEVKNIEAQGNLESPAPAECVTVKQLNNKQNPVDIFSGINKCIESHLQI